MKDRVFFLSQKFRWEYQAARCFRCANTSISKPCESSSDALWGDVQYMTESRPVFVDKSGCARPPRATCARIVVIVCSDSCGSHIGDSGSVVFFFYTCHTLVQHNVCVTWSARCSILTWETRRTRRKIRQGRTEQQR